MAEFYEESPEMENSPSIQLHRDGRCGGAGGGGIIFIVIHLKMLKSFYNYRSGSAINHSWRQFSDTGSANYML